MSGVFMYFYCKNTKNYRKGLYKRENLCYISKECGFFAFWGLPGFQGTRANSPDFTNRLPGLPRKIFFRKVKHHA